MLRWTRERSRKLWQTVKKSLTNLSGRSEMPKQWYNLRADMKNKPAPLLNPGTMKPMTAEGTWAGIL